MIFKPFFESSSVIFVFGMAGLGAAGAVTVDLSDGMIVLATVGELSSKIVIVIVKKVEK